MWNEYSGQSPFDPQITPVRFFEPTPVPSAGATGQAGQAQISQIKKRWPRMSRMGRELMKIGL
jgi:hypothetical protein